MQKRILILCEAIAPPAYSPRVLTLVEWLQANGWECEIVTEMDNNHVFEWNICPIHQMKTYRNLVADKLFGAKETAFYNYACNVVDTASFDLIFCASYYYFPLQAAKQLSKKYSIPLVIDLRDIAEQWGKLDYYTRSFTGIRFIDTIVKKIYTTVNNYQRNRALRYATAVTTVSEWHHKQLARWNKNTHLIYNGYDAEKFYPSVKVSKTFNISFIGKYYSHYERCPELLFAAVKELIEEKQIDHTLIKISFYTNSIGQQAFANLATEYDVQHIVGVYDYISKQETLRVMHDSSILMILTIPYYISNTYGIIGTKFYEILGIEKPCLCLRSDEECLAHVIEKTNAGLAATHVDEVKKFILEKYQEWKENGYTRQHVINKEQFTRQQEAQDFEKLFLECIK